MRPNRHLRKVSEGRRAGSVTTAAFGFGAPKEHSIVQAHPRASGKGRLIIPIALFVLAFGIYLALVETLSAYNVFHQWNVFFDTDPITYTNIYANGWHQVEVAHPLARFLLAPIVRVIGSIIGASGIALGDPLRVRETIMLVLWCAANALKPPLAYGIARLFGTSITTAAAIGVLAAFSYSALVFSVVPESYGLSGLFLTMIFFCVAWTCCRRPTTWSEAGLLVAGFLAAGMTITNLATYGIARMVLLLRGHGYVSSAGRLAVEVVALIALIAVVSVGGTRVLDGAWPGAVAGDQNQSIDAHSVGGTFTRYAGWNNGARFMNTSGALLTTIAAVGVEIEPNTLRNAAVQTIHIMFRSPRNIGLPLACAIYVALAAFLFGSVWIFRRHQAYPVVIAACLSVVGNFMLHSFWGGGEHFLYSQHWMPSLLVVIAAYAWQFERDFSRAGVWVLAATLLISVYNLAYFLSEIAYLMPAT